MKRKLTALFLTLILTLPMLPMTALAAAIPAAWKAPGSLSAAQSESNPYQTNIYFSVDSELLRFIDEEQTDYDTLGIDSIGHTAQIDWKLNNGNWHYTSDWDTQSGEYDALSAIYDDTGYLQGEATDEVNILDLRDEPILRELGGAIIKGATDEDNRLDLKNNTFYFRVRLLVSYNVTDSGEDKFILSPWSETLAYGKDAIKLEKPTYLEKPTISDPKIGKNDDGSPNITFTAITPKQVQDADIYFMTNEQEQGAGASIGVEHQININNTGWTEADAGAWWLSGETRTIDVPSTYDNGNTVVIDKAYIQIRMRYVWDGGKTTGPLTSEWSNIVSVNTPGWSNASPWATSELQKADEMDLIPDMLKGADMTAKITREEFAAVAVKLYENLSGKKAEPVAQNPFTDTTNPEVLKAYNNDVIAGVGGGKFAPKDLLNREQAAAMLTRVYKKVNWDGWTLKDDAAYTKHTLDYSGVTPFKDDAKISGWAKPSVYFMVKNKVIAGIGDNTFAPKNVTDKEIAIGYANATREVAIVIAKRVVENLK